MERITIKASKTYDVLIGRDLLSCAGTYIMEVFSPRTLCLITDSTVDGLYAGAVADSLRQAGFSVCKFVFPAGEASKTMTVLNDMLEFLAAQHLTRRDAIVALGGGVTGDMAGFAAASYLRGVEFIQIPTTLLAAVDSSVGGKTGINSRSGKNLFGAFWQPSLVLCDCNTFDTLPRETFLDGIAEAIKCGVILEKDLFALLSQGQPVIEEVVERCVKMKSFVVEQDEREQGIRQLLNFGHTIGHAIEKCSGYAISHGHGVAMGMVIVSKAANAAGWTEVDCAEPIERLLLQFGFDLCCPYSAEALAQAAASDKKRSGDTISLIIPKTIGHCVTQKLDIALLEQFIASGL